MQIIPILALNDNYIWLMVENAQAVVVDPSDAEPVLKVLAEKQLNLHTILLTHNHHDHTDGVAELIQHYPDVTIYGSVELSDFANQIVQDGDQFELFGKTVQVLNSGGHTAHHISYLWDNQALFCGDALFSGGCGRVFTGDYAAQFATLQRFKGLSDKVKVYCGHEYTQSNLAFAEKVMPPSCALAEYQEWVAMQRQRHLPTLPSNIGLEKQINPFLCAENLNEFIALRQQKDQS